MRFALIAVLFALFVPAAGSAPGDSLNVTDTWNGNVFSRDYHACDAVALILVSGNYDQGKMPNGDTWISVGMTGPNQHIQVNVDGTYQSC